MSTYHPLQILLFTESAMNIFGATIMLLAPDTILQYATSHTTLTASGLPDPARTPSTSGDGLTTFGPAATQLLQLLGGLFYGLTLPMLAVLREGRGVGERRRMVYLVLLCGEVCLIPVLVWQASVASPAGGASLSGGSKGGPAVVAGAFTRNVLLGAAASLGVFGVARGAVLLGKGEWFSDGKGGKKVQ